MENKMTRCTNTTNKLVKIITNVLFTKLILIGFLFVPDASFASDQHPELKAFPPAVEAMVRYVIVLEHKERGEEDAFKVEIVAGKTLPTDGVNQLRLGLSISAKPLKGWGYTFYQVAGSDAVMSTLMAAPEGTQKVDKFVAGVPLLIRYNSRLPVVVYAPKGVEVRYRIWKADDDFVNAQHD